MVSQRATRLHAIPRGGDPWRVSLLGVEMDIANHLSSEAVDVEEDHRDEGKSDSGQVKEERAVTEAACGNSVGDTNGVEMCVAAFCFGLKKCTVP